MMVYRFKYILKHIYPHHVPVLSILQAQLAGMLLGDITPARTGYLSVSYYLRKEVPPATSFSIIAGCQIVEFIVKVFGVLIGLSILGSVVFSGTIFMVISTGAVFLSTLTIIGAVFLWSGRLQRLEHLFHILRLGRLFEKVLKVEKEAMKFRAYLLQIFLLTLLGWLLVGFQWYFIGLSLGMPLEFHKYLLLHPIITTVSFVPISIAGIGFQEGAAVGALVLLGISAKQGIAFSLLARISNMLVDLLGISKVVRK